MDSKWNNIEQKKNSFNILFSFAAIILEFDSAVSYLVINQMKFRIFIIYMFLNFCNRP